MLQGNTVQEATQLNIETLWTGGPFADPVSTTLLINVSFLIQTALSSIMGVTNSPPNKTRLQTP